MSYYTDYHRQQIAKQEYEPYVEGKEVKIDDGQGGKITIGYVAEVEQSGSGFKAYVITDIKLPKNPTQAQLDQVGQVFRINSVKSSKSGFEALIDQHMFGGYTYDEYGNMIDKDGFFVHQACFPYRN